MTEGRDERAKLRYHLLGYVAARLSHDARRGALDAAAGELGSLLTVAPDWVPGLDLLARIRAQQGRLTDAISLWSSAAALAPEDRRIAASLAYARGATRAGSQLYRVGRLSLAALIMFGVVALGSYLLRHRDRAASSARNMPERPAEAGLLSAKASVPNTNGDRDVQPPTLAAIAGMRADTMGGVLRLTPDEGLFRDGAALTTTGAGTLERLGAALVAAPEPVDVIVIGHTDGVPFRVGSIMDNEWLGMQRAIAAMRHLYRSSGVPMGRMTARSAGAGQAPFSTGEQMDQPNNRTVTFLVTRSGERDFVRATGS